MDVNDMTEHNPVYLQWCANADVLMTKIRQMLQENPASVTPGMTPKLASGILTQRGPVATLVMMESGRFDGKHFLVNFHAYNPDGAPCWDAASAERTLKSYFDEANVVLISEHERLQFHITLKNLPPV